MRYSPDEGSGAAAAAGFRWLNSNAIFGSINLTECYPRFLFGIKQRAGLVKPKYCYNCFSKKTTKSRLCKKKILLYPIIFSNDNTLHE
jgi:hypothetical protein